MAERISAYPLVYTVRTVYSSGMSNEIGLREARKEIGPIADRARLAGEITYLTRNGKPVAAVVPLNCIKEPAMSDATYTASIGLAYSVVARHFCDVAVHENRIVGIRDGEGGAEIPVTDPSGPQVMETKELNVRTDDEDVAGKVYDAADDILTANGWRRVGNWDDAAGDAAYATVERA